MYQIDVLDGWDTILGTGQAHVKDCLRLIKDTAAENGRLTLQSYLHNFQPEGCEVEPQWGHSIWNPRAPALRKLVEMNPFAQWQKIRHQYFSSVGVESVCSPPWIQHNKTWLSLYFIIINCTSICIRLEAGHFVARMIRLFRQKAVIQKLQNFSFQK